MEIYANAPIAEAALDIRVRGVTHIPDEVLAAVRDDHYPDMFQRPTTVQVRFEANAETKSSSATTVGTQFGYAYRSEDQHDIFQARPDGFTHNRLMPYQEWNSFAAEARRLWDIYRAAVDPELVEFIGLNYVNDIEVPFGTDFSEFLRTYIEVPKEMPQSLNTFSLAYQVSIPDDGGFLTVGQSYGIPKREGYGVIRLNIQAFRPMQLAIRTEGDSFLWDSFEVLRKAKTFAFEACITDRVREMIR